MASRRLKMRDLERATGVGRETIRYYIREGLLPQPERPGRNVAWYDDGFVDRILVIKDLQRKRFLPLHAIKAMVGGEVPPSRAEVDALVALDGQLFRDLAAPKPVRLSEAARRAGLRAAEVRKLAEVGVLELATRDGDQWVEGDGLRFVELWGRLRRSGYTDALGFGPKHLGVYVDFARWLAREELRIFARGVTGKVDAATATRMAEQGIELVNEMIAIIRKATLLRYIAEGNVPDDAPDELPAAGASRRPSS